MRRFHGLIRAIGGGVERVGGRLRRDMLMRKAEAAGATKKTEEKAVGSNVAGGEAASGRGVSVPEGVPNGGVFLGGNGGFYRNVDGVPAPISDAEAAKILNQINQSDGEANGGLSGQGDNLNDNLNGGKSVSLGYENAPVVEMPLDKLKLSADVPNFKEGADENGVVSGQRLQGKYERVGTAPIVVWERENGDTEVITGRHRLDLARRSGEKSIPAYVVREADGFTVDDARTFDAESNIRDGMGTVRDYAHFFRNKGIDEAEASGKGLLSREKGKRGWAIGKFAEDNLYWLYRNGGISEERAAAVARGAPNDADVQNAALDSAKGMDATTLEIHTRRLKAFKDEGGGNATGEAVQGDLFGVDDSAMREMVALSKAAGELVKQNKQRILAVKGVIKRPEIAREMGVDINNPDAVRAAVAALEYENSRLMSPTPEPEIMDKIRKKAGLFDKAENGENIEQGAGVETQEDTGGLFDDGTAEMSFKRAVKKNPTVLKKLVSAPPVSIAAAAYKGKYELNAKSAFISDVIKGDETVADRCPRAFSALNSALRESPRANEAFGFIRQMAELNANASPLQRVNANIRRRSDVVRKTAVDRLVESGRWFTRMWFDEYEGLERFQKDLERSGVSEEDGLRVINLARNYAGGSVGQVNYSLTVNQIDLDGRIVGKSLRSILRDNLKTAYDKENIDAYLMCRRVVEYYKTEERRVERGGSRSKFGIDYADAVDVVSTATDGMRRCAEELDVYIFIAKFPADLLLIISVLPFSSAVAFLPRFTDFPPTDSVASSEK